MARFEPDAPGPPGVVCFDLGGVVVRLAGSLAEAAAHAGIDPSALAGARLELGDIHELLFGLETGSMDEAEFFDRAGEVMGVDPAILRRVHAAWIIERYPGVVELWRELRERGIVLACLSNTSEPHWRIMSSPGPRHVPFGMLDHALASHRLGHHKPADEAFGAVEKATGHQGGAIGYFDDSDINIDAARRRGWRVGHIDPGGDPAEQMRLTLARWGNGERGA
ncbi:MAG: hypothetical protein JJU36_10080 [Phycisphaeraceae bacterium]|nr:hypothetical protein [Phycisphaeraceae bacterium]